MSTMFKLGRIRKIFLFCLLSIRLFSQESFSEQKLIDSVLSRLDTIDSERDKIILLHQQANYLHDFAPFTKIFLDSALVLASKAAMPDEIAISYLNLMHYYIANSVFDSADWFFDHALELDIVSENSVLRSDFLMQKATIHKSQGNIKGAIEYFLEALTLLESPGLSQSLTSEDESFGVTQSKCILHNNLANLYNDIKDVPSAIRHYDQSYDLLISLDEKAFAGTVLMNKAGLYEDLQIFDTAYLIQLEARKLKEEGVASIRSIAMSDLNIGIALVGLNRLDEALIPINNALNTFIEVDNSDGLSNAYISRGDLRLKSGAFSAAIEDCEQGKALAFETGILDLQRKACDCLFKVYKSTGNYGKALENHEYLKLLSDSLRNNENTRFITQLEMQYIFDREEEERKIEEQAASLQQVEKDARNQLAFIVLAALLVFSIAAVYLTYRNFIIKKKSESQLSQKNDIISKALQEKELLLREIHHRVKNNLQVISRLLRLQSRYIEDDTALNAISAGRNRVHSMALLHENLYQNNNFTGVNMQRYFDRLIEGLFATLNINPGKIQLVKEIAPIDLDIDSVVPIGLITNELITNALKHAFLNQEMGILKVRLFEKGNRLHLEVADNGKGMSTDFFESKSTSFGHKLIKAFATKLHAELRVLNKGGTTVQLVISDYRRADLGSSQPN